MAISKVCGMCGHSTDNKTIVAREMMFGTREEFDYLECANCGCVQLVSDVQDFSKYYPKDYYSFKAKDTGVVSSIEHWLKKKLVLNKMKRNGSGGMYLKLMPNYLKWLTSTCGLQFKSKILDVGCGDGKLLRELESFGFTDLHGVDPFISEQAEHSSPGLSIRKLDIFSLDSTYDFIMLNHSFEHMHEPDRVIKKLCDLMRPNAVLMIRIPVADSEAYRKYHTDWVEFDAPRHIFLHTQRSIKFLAEQNQLSVADILFDSSRFELIGSEKIKMGIPLTRQENPFSKDEIKSFTRRVEELNKTGQAGRACFYLRKND